MGRCGECRWWAKERVAKDWLGWGDCHSPKLPLSCVADGPLTTHGVDFGCVCFEKREVSE